MVGAATLQGAGQDQADPHTCTKNGKGEDKHKGKPYLLRHLSVPKQARKRGVRSRSSY
jgi:hypothetical protein